ncbi:glycosyltransferase family A protein [Rarobacter incanus]|uniref:Glycosyltransferase involved in cell wall biosynthesis n=1 Tax=Rarobacter incanus TaxID=153494 RepID=A0A542SNV8_9MICO|nr:glycosyltransferase family A protein [Rarobacter incanus]TQK76235.1 glycosyltransferase involved in cell wall biosynthesis [Rarobacter incanus]
MQSDEDLDVDVIIAVHNDRRPLERAAASVLEATRARVRVTVVAHNTDPRAIRDRLGALYADPRLRLLALEDGIPSPSGPFNLGLDAATARYTSLLGSDDYLAPGAVDSWLSRAAQCRANVVIAALRHDDGARVPTPVVRPRLRSTLDVKRDRLMYRSAPLGLVDRSAFGHLRFAADHPVGEDLPYVCQLWLQGRVAYDRRGPAYIIGSEATDRVTFTPRSIADEFRYLPSILAAQWFTSAAIPTQSAIVAKFLRIHVFGAIYYRSDPSWWDGAEREHLAQVTWALIREGHGIERVLSRADNDVIAAALDPAVPAARLVAAARRRRRFTRPAALIPARPASLLHREAPLRFMAASYLGTL